VLARAAAAVAAVLLATPATAAPAADPPLTSGAPPAAPTEVPSVLDVVARLVDGAAAPGAFLHTAVEGRHHVRLVWDSPVRGLSVASGLYDLLEPSSADVSDAQVREDGLRQTELSVRVQLRFAF